MLSARFFALIALTGCLQTSADFRVSDEAGRESELSDSPLDEKAAPSNPDDPTDQATNTGSQATNTDSDDSEDLPPFEELASFGGAPRPVGWGVGGWGFLLHPDALQHMLQPPPGCQRARAQALRLRELLAEINNIDPDGELHFNVRGACGDAERFNSGELAAALTAYSKEPTTSNGQRLNRANVVQCRLSEQCRWYGVLNILGMRSRNFRLAHINRGRHAHTCAIAQIELEMRNECSGGFLDSQRTVLTPAYAHSGGTVYPSVSCTAHMVTVCPDDIDLPCRFYYSNEFPDSRIVDPHDPDSYYDTRQPIPNYPGADAEYREEYERHQRELNRCAAMARSP